MAIHFFQHKENHCFQCMYELEFIYMYILFIYIEIGVYTRLLKFKLRNVREATWCGMLMYAYRHPRPSASGEEETPRLSIWAVCD